jgi:hypothetical protein
LLSLELPLELKFFARLVLAEQLSRAASFSVSGSTASGLLLFFSGMAGSRFLTKKLF